METKDQLDNFYNRVDPWGFQTNPEDHNRKRIILEVLESFGFFRNALDIGAGEGWITKDLPAEEIYAIEASEKAKSRLPENVIAIDEPEGKYDLILATGVLYQHYDCQRFLEIIRNHAGGIVLTCNIADWEHPDVKTLPFTQMDEQRFPYREYTQQLRIFTV